MKRFPSKIAIIGVGLIGGSIALGLKKHFGSKITIFGSCSTLKRTELAVKKGVIDLPLTNLGLLSQNTNLIILAAPIRVNLNLLKKISKLSYFQTTIIDVGSTKKSICDLARHLALKSFIGTHPMAGSEHSGFENADPNLFRNKPWIVCGQSTTVEVLTEILGAKPVLLNPKMHDRLTARISHLQLALSSILLRTVSSQKDWPAMKNIASASFREITRGASHDTAMKTDIVLTNKKNILTCLESIKNEINFFSDILKKEEGGKLFNYFLHSKIIRDDWLNLK